MEYKNIFEFINDCRGMELGSDTSAFEIPGVTDGPSLVVRCGGGSLIAYAVGDPGLYSEIAVDFVSDDGKAMQLAVIGRDECDEWDAFPAPEGYQPMHVYAYDGIEEGVQSTQYVTVDALKGNWYYDARFGEEA